MKRYNLRPSNIFTVNGKNIRWGAACSGEKEGPTRTVTQGRIGPFLISPCRLNLTSDASLMCLFYRLFPNNEKISLLGIRKGPTRTAITVVLALFSSLLVIQIQRLIHVLAAALLVRLRNRHHVLKKSIKLVRSYLSDKLAEFKDAAVPY